MYESYAKESTAARGAWRPVICHLLPALLYHQNSNIRNLMQRSQQPNVVHGDLLFAIFSWMSSVVWRAAALTVALLNKLMPDRWAVQGNAWQLMYVVLR